ncbi:MAG: V-type ATPase subunit [Clostridia bacterium]|nr:V-type ATPase subunit [Clostridia bacterium]
MHKDYDYVNGVIAAKEVYLLGAKISKLCEGGVEEAFRGITESGFGKGADAVTVYDYEKLLSSDERDIDGFIREYGGAPEQSYFLSPRDFHNAKALFKARYLQTDAEGMLAPQGLFEISEISRCIESGEYKSLGGELEKACKKAEELFSREEAEVSGAEIGAIFEKALYCHLVKTCAKNPTLKKLLAEKADMTNILTVLRSQSDKQAEKNYVAGGRLKAEQLNGLFEADGEKAERLFDGTGYTSFLRTCLEAKAEGKPMTEAELMRDNAECDYLSADKYALRRSQPFLYYVIRRRAENANVRILFVCLLAGMDEGAIKRRLRAV